MRIGLGLSAGRVRGRSNTVGPELITNGTFDSDLSGWTITPSGASTASWSSGVLSMTGDGTNPVTTEQSFVTVSGRTYQILAAVAVANVAVSVGSTQGGTDLYLNAAQAPGSVSQTFVAASSTTWLRFTKQGASTVTIDGVSVKEA